MVIPEDQDENDCIEDSGDGFQLGGRLSETPLEKQKADIVTNLVNMNKNMMHFSCDIEERL